MTKQEVLQKCTVEGNIVKLPDLQLDRKVYLEVKQSLELIGGTWKGGKVYGFVFLSDPTELLEEIATGEKRNLKKEFQFFGTPASLADELVQRSELKASDRVLEPSAGQGAIIKAINRVFPEKYIEYCELMPVNQTVLRSSCTAIDIGNDFLLLDEDLQTNSFDKIIANPPFSKNQDIDHVRKMYRHLRKGGRIVTITSKHWLTCENKKEKEFKQWLESINAYWEEVPQGAFKESGTNVAALILVIDK